MKLSQGLFIALAGIAPVFAQEAAQAPPADSAIVLKAKVIKGARPLTNRESAQVARMPLKNLANPQAYTVVPKELTKQQMSVDLNSALKNVAGASKASQYMQGQSQFYSRGFSASTSEMRNGLSTNVVTDFDAVNTERIEAVRGPGGALFGAGAGVSYGGFFNRATKMPLRYRQGEVSYQAGSWNLSRLTADYNAPLNDEKTLLLRLNLARHVEGSFLDQGFTDAWALAPVLTYQVNDRLKLTLDAEFYRKTGTSAPSMWVSGTTATSMKDLGLGYRRSFLDNSLATESRTQNIFAQADYRISDEWSSETILATTSSASDLKSVYVSVFNDSQATRWLDNQAWKVYTRQIQQNFRGAFSTDMLNHQALIGLSASNYNYSWPYTLHTDTVNYLNPGAAYLIGEDIYRARIASQPFYMSTYETNAYSIYAADAIHYDRYTLLIGARWDLFEDLGSGDGITGPAGDYRQQAVSPRIGVVVQPWKDRVALFANAMSGYKNVNGRSVNNARFSPEHALQTEAGVKVMAPGGILAGTVSVYNIEVQDVLRSDAANPGFSVQDGTQRSQGLEIDVVAYPLRGVSAVAGYAFNKSKLVKADPDVEGRRPPGAGPEQSANFWVSYETPQGLAKGLGAGLGGNYVSEAYHANTASYEFTVPAYALWDATVFYNQPKYRIGAKVDNLTNQKYWSPEGLQAGALRRFIGEVTYRF